MKKLYLLMLILFLFQQCTKVQIVDNKRLQIKGHIQNTSGQPIENVPIDVQSYRSSFKYGESPHTISSGVSDASGNFSITSVDVERNQLFIKFNSSWNNAYQAVTFLDKRPGRDENLIDFGSLTLLKPVRFNLHFNNESNTEQSLNYKITYRNNYPVIPVENWIDLAAIEDDEDNTTYILREGSIEAGETEGAMTNLTFSSLEETVAILQYSVGNPVDEDSEEIPIPVTLQDTVHEIIY